MPNQNSESTIKTIFIGVTTSVLTAAALYFFNLDNNQKRNSDVEDSKVKAENYKQEIATQTPASVITEDEIKQKEFLIKKKRLDIEIKKLEDENNNVSTDNTTDYDLSGQWAGNNGLAYIINQNKTQISMDERVELFGTRTISSHASGFITGNKVNGTAIGLLGQQFEFNLKIINDKSLEFSFLSVTGEYSTIKLTKQ